MNHRTPERRSASLRGFSERMEKDFQRHRARRDTYLQYARIAKDRDDMEGARDWIVSARNVQKRLMQMRKYQKSLDRQAAKIEGSADLKRPLERKQAAE